MFLDAMRILKNLHCEEIFVLVYIYFCKLTTSLYRIDFRCVSNRLYMCIEQLPFITKGGDYSLERNDSLMKRSDFMERSDHGTK